MNIHVNTQKRKLCTYFFSHPSSELKRRENLTVILVDNHFRRRKTEFKLRTAIRKLRGILCPIYLLLVLLKSVVGSPHAFTIIIKSFLQVVQGFCSKTELLDPQTSKYDGNKVNMFKKVIKICRHRSPSFAFCRIHSYWFFLLDLLFL